MITFLWSFLSGNWAILAPAIGFVVVAVLTKDLKLIFISVAVLLLTGYISTLRAEVQSMRSEIAVRDKTIASVNVALQERDALITTQNGYVSAWKAAALKQTELSRLAQQRSNALAAQAARASIPQAPQQVAACQERDSWLRSELNSLLWR